MWIVAVHIPIHVFLKQNRYFNRRAQYVYVYMLHIYHTFRMKNWFFIENSVFIYLLWENVCDADKLESYLRFIWGFSFPIAKFRFKSFFCSFCLVFVEQKINAMEFMFKWKMFFLSFLDLKLSNLMEIDVLQC